MAEADDNSSELLRWQCGGSRALDLTRRGAVMGILNVTPDSFSDGGNFEDPRVALDHALEMRRAGAKIIDVGGESTRPGAGEVSEAEEMRRVLPVIEALRREAPEILVSIDTAKSAVARAAVDAGATIVNDISGLTGDPRMAEVVAETKTGVVIMHMQGTPRTMQRDPHYEDVVAEVGEFFERQFRVATAAGVSADAIVFDPGFGFGKTLEHNLQLLRNLDRLVVGGRPILIGVSRKSFIAKLIESSEIANRTCPTVAITSFARERGVRLHRVHDVRENVEALRITEAILHGCE